MVVYGMNSSSCWVLQPSSNLGLKCTLCSRYNVTLQIPAKCIVCYKFHFRYDVGLVCLNILQSCSKYLLTNKHLLQQDPRYTPFHLLIHWECVCHSCLMYYLSHTRCFCVLCICNNICHLSIMIAKSPLYLIALYWRHRCHLKTYLNSYIHDTMKCSKWKVLIAK